MEKNYKPGQIITMLGKKYRIKKSKFCAPCGIECRVPKKLFVTGVSTI